MKKFEVIHAGRTAEEIVRCPICQTFGWINLKHITASIYKCNACSSILKIVDDE